MVGDGAIVGEGLVMGVAEGPGAATVGVVAGVAWVHAVHISKETTLSSLLRGGLKLHGTLMAYQRWAGLWRPWAWPMGNTGQGSCQVGRGGCAQETVGHGSDSVPFSGVGADNW